MRSFHRLHRTLYCMAAFSAGFFGPPRISGQLNSATTLVYPPLKHAPVHKATAAHLFAYMALIGRVDITPSDPQGISATRLRSTDDPLNRNDDDDLTVYGINSGQNNIIFNSSMQSIDIYEGKGPRQKLKRPRGIASSINGDVYVADTGHHRIVKLQNPGSYLQFVDAYGKEGGKHGEFNLPMGVALSSDGKIYVADTGNDRIQVFDPQMKFLFAIGEKADSATYSETLFQPNAIAVTDPGESTRFFNENFLIVSDLNNSRLSKLSLDGKFMAAVNSTDYGFPKVSISSVALDFYSNVWVTDSYNHCIHKFDRNLNYITSFGRKGEGENEFLEPHSMAIWKRFGQVFVVDRISAQYFHVGTDIRNMEISQRDSSIHFDFFLTEYSRVSARIVDDQGAFVAALCDNALMKIGNNALSWNRVRSQKLSSLLGRQPLRVNDSVGTHKGDSLATKPGYCPSGLYKIQIEAKTNYLYSRYFSKKLELEFAF
jgi:DNA-binding beta-propeller fold protein YncE